MSAPISKYFFSNLVFIWVRIQCRYIDFAISIFVAHLHTLIEIGLFINIIAHWKIIDVALFVQLSIHKVITAKNRRKFLVMKKFSNDSYDFHML